MYHIGFFLSSNLSSLILPSGIYKDKSIVFDMEKRLGRYWKRYLGGKLDIFLEMYEGRIASTIFYLYYENLLKEGNNKFII